MSILSYIVSDTNVLTNWIRDILPTSPHNLGSNQFKEKWTKINNFVSEIGSGPQIISQDNRVSTDINKGDSIGASNCYL